MDKNTEDFQKSLKGLGLFYLGISFFLVFILVMDLLEIQNGKTQLTIPLWQFLLEPIIFITLQASMAICAILFAKTNKVKICMYISIIAIACMSIFIFIINRDGSFFSKMYKLIFPALYFAISFNLVQSLKQK